MRSNLSSEEDEGEWREAKDLRISVEILKADGTWAKVESVKQIDERAKFYNFEVADNHNFFIGLTGLLAHNNRLPLAFQNDVRKLKHKFLFPKPYVVVLLKLSLQFKLCPGLPCFLSGLFREVQ